MESVALREREPPLPSVVVWSAGSVSVMGLLIVQVKFCLTA